MNHFLKFQILFLLILSYIFIGCSNCASQYTYRSPEFTNDGLEVGTLEQVGMDPLVVSKTMDCMYANKYGQVHSMLIYKDGLLVFEEYNEGNKYQWDGPYHYGERIQWHRDSLHMIMSCSKSVTSACVGIAVDKGLIKSVDESIFNYLPDHQQFNKDGKEHITIEHLLTMTSGIKWDEWSTGHGTSANDIDKLYFEYQHDPISGVLEKPLQHDPGEVFTYNGGGTIILGEIIKNATQMNIGDFSEKYLFEPLDIDPVGWYQFDNGTYATDGSVRLTSRDMLKFGVTYLNEGTWHNEQIVSRDWVIKSKTPYNNNTGINIPIDDSGRNGYAYTWWTNEIPVSGVEVKLFQASGWGGQEIIVFPELQMVIVFTGGNYVAKKHIYKILKKYVLPAIQ